MEYQSESNRLLYSQLLAECGRGGTSGGRGLSFVSKNQRGQKYWYLQLVVGSAKTQHYLGPDSEELRARMAREKELWTNAEPDRRSREKLVAMLIAGGAATVSASEARILELLDRSGVFLVDGTVVGSHAFGIYANMLGVRWESETIRTQDLDLAAANNFEIGIHDKPADLHKALLESGMGFFEVPALNRKYPSTSYMIRGQQFTVDLLTPMYGAASAQPVEIKALRSSAEPVRFLDYLLADKETAVVVARAGILVNVPAPARYALHKLVIAKRRKATMQTKVLKDIAQAQQLIELLIQDRPGDLMLAWEAAREQPEKFQKQMSEGFNLLPKDQQNRLKETLGIE